MLKEFPEGHGFLSPEGWFTLEWHTFIYVCWPLDSNIQIQWRCMWVSTTINYVPRSIIVRECLKIWGLEMHKVVPFSNERLHQNSQFCLKDFWRFPNFWDTSCYEFISILFGWHHHFMHFLKESSSLLRFSRRSMWMCWWHCSVAVGPPKTRTD